MPAAPASEGKALGILTTALVSTCLTLLALSPLAYMLYRHSPPVVATVDLQKIVEDEQKRMVEAIGVTDGKVSDEKRAASERMTADFAKRLSAAVDQLGQECGCVIVNKAALLGGMTTDYTEQLQARLKK